MTNDFEDCKNLFDFVVLIQSLEEDADKARAVWDQARSTYWDARRAAERNGFDRCLLDRVLKSRREVPDEQERIDAMAKCILAKSLTEDEVRQREIDKYGV